MERTLIIFKPDAVMRGVVGEILSRFEKVGLKIVGSKMLKADYDHLYAHYQTIGTLKDRAGEKIFETTVAGMMEGPVIAFVLEGIEAAELVRKMVGSTEPKSAQPGTIRGDYSHVSYGHANTHGTTIPNVIHASADADEAAKEISHWFADSELYDYENVHEKFTQPRTGKK
ncbi:MAG TPA: nucleoside-diphosphate kinase [Candidatus Saccharimonadales bacterium]|nr:nucleoside-diphosphate kinase [Candidatus Saccharimonadales bacterium]